MALVNFDNYKEVVRYHAPNERQLLAHENLAVAAENFIYTILTCCPSCADTSAAIRHVREAKMTASAAVALNGLI